MYDFQSISCLVKSGRARTIDYNWVFSSVTVVPKWLLNSTKLQNTLHFRNINVWLTQKSDFTDNQDFREIYVEGLMETLVTAFLFHIL